MIIILLPAGTAAGQDISKEQKIKVVVTGDNGTTIVIDTTFINQEAPDSIIAKDGTVIYITDNDSDFRSENEKKYEITARLENKGKNSKERYIYINSNKAIKETDSDKFDIFLGDDVSNIMDNDTDKTRYVIAKNGVTITVEGNDEAKIKDLAEKIRKELDIKEKEE